MLKAYRQWRDRRAYAAGRRWALEMLDSGEGPIVLIATAGRDTPHSRGARAAIREHHKDPSIGGVKP